MRQKFPMVAAAALALAVSACGSPPEDKPTDTAGPTTGTATPAATVAAADKKPIAFAQCASCHAVEPGKHGIGPSLAGVYGTKSGEIAGYAFSEPMKQAGLTWDDATLDAYLTNPMKVIPGTKMTYAGMGDPAKRKDVIAYMKTLK
jgi:cytochrome c